MILASLFLAFCAGIITGVLIYEEVVQEGESVIGGVWYRFIQWRRFRKCRDEDCQKFKGPHSHDLTKAGENWLKSLPDTKGRNCEH